MKELIGAKGTISLLKAAVPKKGPKSDLFYGVWHYHVQESSAFFPYKCY
jgi:hypothetical protein